MRCGAPGAAPLLLLGLAFVLPAAPARALEPAPEVARAVAFGEDEGTCRRWNERLPSASPCGPAVYRPGPAACPRGENARRVKLLRHLRAIAPGTVSVRAQVIDPLPTHATMETVAWQRRR